MKFLRRWMLVIGMLAGAGLYIFYRLVPALHPAGSLLLSICKWVQPVLLFTMLFLTFSKIEPKELKPHRWQWWLLTVQGGCFIVLALILKFFPGIGLKVGLESLMLCMIMPTATACSVVTDRLGGDMAGVLTYTVLINILTAVLVPLFVPLVHPVEGMDFFSAFSLILAKVFPLLILPCLCAWLIRYMCPRLHKKIAAMSHLSFYIWALALTLAILMSARAIYHNEGSAEALLVICAASLTGCVFQFWAGRKIGAHYDREKGQERVREITAGQAMGQKNTVFGIWMGYTFLDPIVSICGGFYSIFHNLYNTWQLRKK